MLEALEDAEDAVAFDEAMAEEGPSIPWAQVKADLDWV
jgi:antitoxin Phd